MTTDRLRPSNFRCRLAPCLKFVIYFFICQNFFSQNRFHSEAIAVAGLLGCGLKAHANGRNKSQHCCLLLAVFSQQYCVRLHGPTSLTGFKLYETNANKCQHCCGSMQTDATCWAQQCCVLLPNNVSSVCMGLKHDLLARIPVCIVYTYGK